MNFRSRIILYVFLSFATLMFSCLRKDRTTEETLAQMLSTKVNLCFSRMEMCTISSCVDMETNCDTSLTKYRLVVFSDSTECTPCLISRMSDWKEVTYELFSDSCRSIKLLFIYSPSHDNIKKIKQFVENLSPEWPIYLDTANIFLRENKQIPINRQFHVFLLNEENEILCVGNPLYNKKMRDIYKRIIKGEYNF